MLEDDEGTSSIEFALVASILLTILFGTFVYGHYFAVRIALVHAASEGARASVAGLTDAERETYARQAVQDTLSTYGNFIPAAGISVQTTPAASRFQVQVAFDFDRLGYGALQSFVPLPDSRPAHISVAMRGGY